MKRLRAQQILLMQVKQFIVKYADGIEKGFIFFDLNLQGLAFNLHWFADEVEAIDVDIYKATYGNRVIIFKSNFQKEPIIIKFYGKEETNPESTESSYPKEN
jgi:hypothetical protein